MLDECKGDKFEEVISAVALLVLRNASGAQHPEVCSEDINSTPKEQLLPLILAHRQSLKCNLQQRKDISQQTRSYAAKLASENTKVQQRQQGAQQGFEVVDEADLTRLSEMVRSSWIGDDRWSNILLEGRAHGDHTLLQESFKDSWPNSINHGPRHEAKSDDLATELEERIAKQEARLKQWKTFHASLVNVQGGEQKKLLPREQPGIYPFLRFDKHKELRLDSQILQKPVQGRLGLYHMSILKNMQNELAFLSASPAALHPLPIVRDGTTERKTQANTLDIALGSTAGRGLEGATNDLTTFNLSGDCRRSVGLQREKLPEILRDLDIGSEMQTLERKATDSPVTGRSPDIQSEGPESLLSLRSSSFAAPASVEFTPQALEVNVQEVGVAPDKQRIERSRTATLVERTRASLTPFTAEANPPEAPTDSPGDDNEDDEDQVLPALPEIAARRGTLLERTRQSMSLLPNPPPQPKTSQKSSVKQPRFSEVFPVNQFETPGKPQSQQREWSTRSGSSTPRDSLFSEEADYASVFKSRPRIAVSPSLSPERSNFGLDSMLVDGIDDLNLKDEDATPSRSPIRSGR